MKYAFIRGHRQVWPIRIQCRVLGASVAGYYEHWARLGQMAVRRHRSDEALVVHIRAVYQAHRGAYGWPRIWRALRAQGVRVGKQRVQRLMQVDERWAAAAAANKRRRAMRNEKIQKLAAFRTHQPPPLAECCSSASV